MMTPSGHAIRAVVFDFGGVLLDWNPRHLYRKLFPGNEAAMEGFLIEIGFSEWNLQQDSGRGFAVGVQQLVDRFPAYSDLIRAFDERWAETVAGPIDGTVALLPQLRRAGYQLLGLSNWSREKFSIVRPQYEFFDLFDMILISGDAKLVKPDPRLYTLLLEQAGRTAAECLFIDDSDVNVRGARILGFDAIHFESPDQLLRELRQRGLLDIVR